MGKSSQDKPSEGRAGLLKVFSYFRAMIGRRNLQGENQALNRSRFEQENRRTAELSEEPETPGREPKHTARNVAELNVRIEQLAAALAGRDRAIAQARRALWEKGDIIRAVAALESLPIEPPAPRGKGWRLRGAVLAAAVILAVGGYLFYQPAYQLTAWIALPADQERLWAEIGAMAENAPDVRANAEPQRGLLTLSVTAPDPESGQARLDDFGERVLETARSVLAAQAVDRLSPSEEYVQLARSLSAADPEAFGRMNPSLPFSDELRRKWRETWEQVQADRKRIAAALTEANERIAVRAAERIEATADEQHVTEAEQNDRELVADLEEQRKLRRQLADTLLEFISVGRTRLGEYNQAVAESTQVLIQELEADHGPHARECLSAMRAAVSDGSAAATSLSRLLDESNAALSEKGAALDLSGLLSVLGPAARQFIDRSAGAEDRLNEALESIKSSADYLPTRLAILYNKLSRQMRGTLEARSAAVSAVQAVYLSRNVALAQQVNRISQLTARIEDRRAEIRNRLLQEARSDLEARHKAAIEKATAERDRLQREWDERQQKLMGMAEEAMQDLTAYEARREQENLSRLIDWHRRHGDDLARLLALAEAREQALNDLPGPGAVYYVPPDVAGTIRSTGRPWFWVVLAGAAPLAIYWLGGTLIAARRVGRRHQPPVGSLTFAELEALSLDAQEIPAINEPAENA